MPDCIQDRSLRVGDLLADIGLWRSWLTRRHVGVVSNHFWMVKQRRLGCSVRERMQSLEDLIQLRHQNRAVANQ